MNTTLCNMCMIEDAATGRVLVLASDQRPAAGRANSVPGQCGDVETTNGDKPED